MTTKDYLRAVFGDTEGVAHMAVGSGGHVNGSGRYEFTAWTPTTFAWPAEAEQMLRAVGMEVAAGSDVYVGPYLMHGSKRAKGAAVEHRLIHADVDHGHLDLEAVRAVGGFAVASGSPGNGHVYVALDRAVTAVEHTTLCRALGTYLGGADAKVTDNDLLRPPGTVNGKHDPPASVSWLVQPSGRLWEPQELAGVLGVDLTRPTVTAPPVGVVETVDVASLPQRVRDALANVTDDRSADTMRVIGACHDAGLTLAQTRGVVADRADLAERLAERADDDVLTCWLKVTDERAVRAAERRREAEWAAELAGGTELPPEPTVNTETGEVPQVGASWSAVDLAEVVAGVVTGTITRPAPTIGRRSDGQALFYPGKVNGVAGASNAGKSWTGFYACSQEITDGQHVVYIDLEDDMAAAVARLLDLGVPADVIVERFHYVSPAEAFTYAAAEAFGRLLDEVRPSLVVVDSTGESMALDGAKPNDDDDVARWFRRLPTSIARRSGAAVLVLDHVTKAEDGGLWPIGSQRKRAAIGGAQYMQVNVRPFDRTTPGFSKLVCAKDRHGIYHQGQTVALVHLTPHTEGVDLELRAPAETSGSGIGQWRPTAIMERISRALEDADEPMSVRALDRAVNGKKEHKQIATDLLVKSGHVDLAQGPRRAVLHQLVRPYRQTDDPLSDLYQGPGDSHPSNDPETPSVSVPVPRKGDGGHTLPPSPGDSRGTVGDGHTLAAVPTARRPLPTDDEGRPLPCPECGRKPHHTVTCEWGKAS